MNYNIDTTGCVKEEFNAFVRGMIDATLTGNVLSMTNTPGAYLFDHARPTRKRGSEMYLRTAYTGLMAEINSSVRPAIVTGTPGTGKTTMRNFVAYRLLQEPLLNVGDRRLILFQTGDPDKHYKIVMERMADTVTPTQTATTDTVTPIPATATDTATPTQAVVANVDLRLYSSDTFDLSMFDAESGQVYRLIDVNLDIFDKTDLDTERVIIFTSPNSRLEKHFVKHHKARILYMPLWSRAECIEADTALNLHLGDAVINQRYIEVGGVARFVLELDPSAYQDHLDVTLPNAVNVMEEVYILRRTHSELPDSTARNRHSLVYYEVQHKADGSYDFKRVVSNFGTKYILVLVGTVLCTQFDKVLDLEVTPYHTRESPSILGHIAEGCAASRMAERGLEGIIYATLGKPPTATKKFVVNFDTNNRFNRPYTKQYVDVENMDAALAGATAGTMIIPNSLYYPTIDYILVSDTNPAEPDHKLLYAFVQVTIAHKHDVGAAAAETFMQLIATIGATSAEVAGVFFFVPPTVYKVFSETKAPKIAGYTGRMMKCTLQK